MSQEERISHATNSTEKDTNRLEAFSDGVFAIAITLLVLDLKVPSNLPSVDPTTLARALGERWPSYLTFVLSFATILIMWVYHHRMFQSVRRANTALLFSNGLLLLGVSAVPFPTSLVGTYLATPAAPVACAIYAGFFVGIDLAYSLLWWVVSCQQPAERLQEKHFARSKRITFLGIPCYLIALAVAFWQPWLTLLICALLWIVWATTAPQVSTRP